MRMSDKLSELPTVQRDNASADDVQQSIIVTRLTQFCYLFVCLHILFFNYLAVTPTNVYDALFWEDGLIENFTAVVFLLAGIMLLATSLAERRISARCVYIFGGVALAFFGFEEISWGQRVIGYETPDFLTRLNYQGEFNVHNIRFVDSNFLRPIKMKELISALGMVGCVAFFCRKDRVFGIPTPSILLILAFLVIASYIFGREVPDFSRGFSRLILTWHRGLLLVLLLFALFSRNAMLFITAAASLSIALVTAYLLHHDRGLWFGELHEYLFSVICFFYALTALLSQGVARQKIAAALKPVGSERFLIHIPSLPTYSGRFFAGIRGGYLTPWTVICALIIAGSFGLAVMAHFDVREEVDAFKDTYLLAQTIEPTARSKFDVYLVGRDLHYIKQPCDQTEVESTFFLGVFPADVTDIPRIRREFGFDNLDFRFNTAYGAISGGACTARVRLPGYEIASISTGQYIIEEDGVLTNLWIVEFPVGGE